MNLKMRLIFSLCLLSLSACQAQVGAGPDSNGSNSAASSELDANQRDRVLEMNGHSPLEVSQAIADMSSDQESDADLIKALDDNFQISCESTRCSIQLK